MEHKLSDAINYAEDFLLGQVKNDHSPSVQYQIFSKDEVLFKFLYGLADVRKQRTISELDQYHAFSTTKTFTALAILQLAEKKLLDIDLPVQKYLPDFLYGPDITIKHLLNHTSGIPNPIPLSWIHTPDEHARFNAKTFFEPVFSKHRKAKCNPNEKFAYSNLNYILLGQLIEKVSGLSYEQYIAEHILKLLEIEPDELGFTFSEAKPQAKGYHKRFSFSNLMLGLFLNKSKFMDTPEGKWQPFRPYYMNGSAYGGLVGTAESFRKYLQELLKPGSKLLSDDFKKQLFRENKTNEGKPTGMCLSWFTGQLNGQPYFSHAGGGGGYYCEIRLYPTLGMGSVIMFNRSGMTDERILDRVDGFFIE